MAALPATAKLPHMGWNQLRRVRPSVLLEGVPADAYFYFAHTYAALDAGEAAVAMCDHGAPFVAALERGNLFAVQFHPEKSGEMGARVLANFVRRYRAQRAGAAVMTLARRIIPCLDTDGERVVKGVNSSTCATPAIPPRWRRATTTRAPTNWSCWISPPRAITGRRFSKRFAAWRRNWRFR